MWLQMAKLFGKSFYREHGEKPNSLWVQAVARLQDHEIKKGLVNLAQDGLEFPANLSQFVAACQRSEPVRQLGVKYLEDSRNPGTMSLEDWRRQNDL